MWKRLRGLRIDCMIFQIVHLVKQSRPRSIVPLVMFFSNYSFVCSDNDPISALTLMSSTISSTILAWKVCICNCQDQSSRINWVTNKTNNALQRSGLVPMTASIGWKNHFRVINSVFETTVLVILYSMQVFTEFCFRVTETAVLRRVWQFLKDWDLGITH